MKKLTAAQALERARHWFAVGEENAKDGGGLGSFQAAHAYIAYAQAEMFLYGILDVRARVESGI